MLFLLANYFLITNIGTKNLKWYAETDTVFHHLIKIRANTLLE